MNPQAGSLARRYRFGSFVLNETARVLTRDGELMPLPPKAVDTLLVLVQRAGEVVTRDELLERVWPDAFVEPNNLAQQVSAIREALDDGVARPRFVETVSRRGYRFVATVRVECAPQIAPERPTARAGIPEVRYARSGRVNIAYQVVGEGPIDIVFVMGWVSHLEEFWTEPSFAHYLDRLAGFARLILFDKRGTGLSDRVVPLPTLEERMDDVRAVMDAVGSRRAALLGVSEGGPMCALFAASHPERTMALVMIGSYARRLWAPDYPWGVTPEARQTFYTEIEQQWGGPVGIDTRAPTRASDPEFRRWWAHYLRQGASPGAALALAQMNADVDVRDVLPLVRVPTLVLHRVDDRCLRIEEGRYLASRIPGARCVELAGSDHLPFVGDQESLLDEIQTFLTGLAGSAHEQSTLSTVLCVTAASASAAAGHVEPLMMPIVAEHRGQWIEPRMDPWRMTFDGPVRAIRAGLALVSALSASSLPVRAGLHTGECVRRGAGVAGVAVDLANQLASRAAAGELLISRTVKDLVAGAGFCFIERGSHTLPFDGTELPLYAARA